MHEPLLTLEDVHTHIGRYHILQGVDLVVPRGWFTVLLGRNGAGKTVLLVEHKMDVVRALADRIVVLHNGRLVADGKPADVIASPIVQEAYLGIAPGKSAA